MEKDTTMELLLVLVIKLLSNYKEQGTCCLESL